MALAAATLEKNTGGKPPGPERRTEQRFQCHWACNARPDTSTGVGSWSGMVYNISRNGIGLALTYPVRPGTILLIEPLAPRACPVRARVVRCTVEGFVWFHGCELLLSLTDTELQTWIC